MNMTNKALEDHVLHFLRHLFGFGKSERLLLYTDQHSDLHLAETIQNVAIEIGAVVRWVEIIDDKSLEEGGKFLVQNIQEFSPTKICPLSEQYYYQTPVWRHGVKGGAQIYRPGGLNADGFIRCIGQVDQEELLVFGKKISNLLNAAKSVALSSGGQILSMRMGRDFFSRVVRKLTKRNGSLIYAPSGVLSDKNPTTFVGGQIAFLGVPDSIEGVFVVDSYVWPPKHLKQIDEELALTIQKGSLVDITGQGQAAVDLRKWLPEPKNRLMHVCLGFNPGATFSYGITEAERVMGSVTLGIGEGELHSDSVSANATVMIDKEAIVRDGKFVHPELREFAKRLTS